MLFALGLGDSVVAVTHECDHPPEARTLPHLTRTVLPDVLSAGEIDAAVKAIVGEGRALYDLDEKRLAELAPDLIVTQAVCDVCAVSYEDVVEVAARLPSRPRVVQQDPSTLGEMLEDVIRLGEATGIGGAGPRAARRARGTARRRSRRRSTGPTLPRVIALEWLDPPYVGGHWIPEMISIAGGEDVAGPPGLKSPEVGWGELSGLGPDVVVAMPCGWYVEDSRAQAVEHWERIEALGAAHVFAVDAASTFSRPGPRLVDGVELLGHLLHPDLIDPPGNIELRRAADPGDTRRPCLLAWGRRRSQATAIAAAIEMTAIAVITASSAGRCRAPSLPRSPATIANAQMTPATRPPRWPPRLICGSPKLIARLNSRTTPIVRGDRVEATPAGDHERRAENAEDRPRGPERERIRAAQQERAEGAREQRREVDEDKAGGADRRLQDPPEEVEGDHVEADMGEARRGGMLRSGACTTRLPPPMCRTGCSCRPGSRRGC